VSAPTASEGNGRRISVERITKEIAQGFKLAFDAMTDRQAKDHLAACLQDKYGAWWRVLEDEDAG